VRIILTDHAKKRMAQRAISMHHIQEALDLPDYTVSKGRLLESVKKFNDKTLQIVVEKKDKYIKVITVEWK